MNKNQGLVAVLVTLAVLTGSTCVQADHRDDRPRDRDRYERQDTERDREETQTTEPQPAPETQAPTPPPADPPQVTTEVAPQPDPAAPQTTTPPPEVAGPPVDTPATPDIPDTGNENPAPTPGEGQTMVTLCHVPPDVPHSITVAKPSEVQAHLAHGDSVGGCNNEMAAPAAGVGSVIVICRPGGGGIGHQLSVSPVGRVSHISVSCD